MKKASLFLKVLGIVVIVGAITTAGLAWYNKPLTTSLNLNIPVQEAQATATAPAVAQQVNCGETGAFVFQFTSYDSSSWDQPHGADMVRYFRADFSNLTIDQVALPRDLWLKTPVLSEKKIAELRFGEVFEYEPNKPLSEQKELIIKSTTNIAQTVFDNFNVSPAHYVTLDANTFNKMIDTIGGVTVNNPYALKTKNYEFAQGDIQLNGAQASEFSRWLNNGETEWTRFKRQESVLLGIWKKMTLPENIIKLPALLKEFNDVFITDFSPAQITNLFCLVDKVSLEKLASHDVTPDMVTMGGPGGTFIPDVKKIETLLKTVLFPKN